MMPQLFQTKYWQVQLPGGWAALRHSEEFVTLYSPSGVGMLVFMIFDQKYDGAGVGEDYHGKLSGKYHRGTAYQGSFQRSWHLSCLGRVLMVKYRCAEKNAEIEHVQVDEVLHSLEESRSQSN
jgi:hypothetical protein